MKDLIIIEDSTFVLPEESTTDELRQASQAYITLFLTKIGSVEQIPSQGSDFELGSVNANRFIFFANKFNNQVLDQIREPYNIIESQILSIAQVGSTVKMTVRIVHQSGESVDVSV